MENASTRKPNAVVVAIDDGHYFKTVGGEKGQPDRQVCRHDAEPWPCLRIREARRINAAQFLSLRGAKAPAAAEATA